MVIEIFTIQGLQDLNYCCGSHGLHSNAMFETIAKWCRNNLSSRFTYERLDYSTKWIFSSNDDASLFTNEWQQYIFENN